MKMHKNGQISEHDKYLYATFVWLQKFNAAEMKLGVWQRNVA